MHERDDSPNFQRPALAIVATEAPLDSEPEASDVEPSEAPNVDQPAPPDETERLDLMAGDYPLLAAPSISLPAFAAILSAAKSPAAGDAAGIYNALKKYGVDPAVGLAIFQHESNFGKAGTATKTMSIGNSRYYGDAGGLGITKYVTASNGSFAKYPSYTVAAEDLGRLLSSSMYGKSANYNTVRTFAAKYAPAADHNSPSGYGASVANAIAKWTGSAGSTFAAAAAAVPLTAHELHVQHLASLAAMGKGATGAASTAIAGLNTSHLLVLLAAGGILLLLLVLLRGKRGGGVQTVKVEAAD